MLRSFSLATLATIACVAPAAAQDAQSILKTMREKQEQRSATVDNYTVTLSVRDAAGAQAPLYYEKSVVDGHPTFRQVPPGEYQRTTLEKAGFPPPGPDALREMASGYRQLGSALAQGGGDMPANGGIPGFDMRQMTDQMAMVLDSAAVGQERENDGRGDAARETGDMAKLAARARLIRTESVNASAFEPGKPVVKRDAYVIVADDVSDIELEQPEDASGRFELDKVTVWIDKVEYVPLRLLMEGRVESGGQSTPLTIEKLDLGYDHAGPLYEARQHAYHLSGIMSGMSEKQKQEMEKARKQMEEFRTKLASMPASQREMVMKMMGPQMAKLEQMTAGGDITSIVDVVSIAVNEGPPTPYGKGTLTVGGPAAASFPGALTLTGEDRVGSSAMVAELSVTAQLPDRAEASIGLVGAAVFPQSGAVAIADASGHVALTGAAAVTIEGGSGTITVSERTKTHIAGTFTAMLTGTESTANGPRKVQFSASGSFDTGAPVGPYQAPRGSPFPADLFGSGGR